MTQEIRYLKNQALKIKSKKHLYEFVLELYVLCEFSEKQIVNIIKCRLKSITINQIIKILEKYDIKKCSKGDQCKSLTGPFLSRDNFCKDSQKVDSLQSICQGCRTYQTVYKKANLEKRKHMDTFSNLTTLKEKMQYIVKLYTEYLYSYRVIYSITQFSYNQIIKILENYDIKKCGRGSECVFRKGYIQSRSNFSHSPQTLDNLYEYCNDCAVYESLYRRLSNDMQQLLRDFHYVFNDCEKEKTILELYKYYDYTIRNIVGFTFYEYNEIINILRRYDIKKCVSKDECVSPYGSLQSQNNFFKSSDKIDGLEYYCIYCNKNYNHSSANYDYYKNQLFANTKRRDPENHELLQVQCKNCKEWFNPTNYQVKYRINSLNNEAGRSEGNFYCSDECKNSCPLFNVKKVSLNNDDSKRIFDEVRKFKIDITGNPTNCESCGKLGDQHSLILHHIIPVAINHIYEADLDNLIWLCSECHKKAHKKEGCNYFELKQEKRCNQKN